MCTEAVEVCTAAMCTYVHILDNATYKVEGGGGGGGYQVHTYSGCGTTGPSTAAGSAEA